MLNNLLEEYSTTLNKVQSANTEQQRHSLVQKLDSLYFQAISTIQEHICKETKLDTIKLPFQALYQSFCYDAQRMMPLMIDQTSWISFPFFIPVVAYEKTTFDLKDHKDLAKILSKKISIMTQQPATVMIANKLAGLSVVAHPNEMSVKINKAINTKLVDNLFKEESYFEEEINNTINLSISFVVGAVLLRREHSHVRELFYNVTFREELEETAKAYFNENESVLNPIDFTFESNEAAQLFRESLFENRFVLQVSPYFSACQQEEREIKGVIHIKDFDTKIVIFLETIEDSEDNQIPSIFEFDHANPYEDWQTPLTFLMEAMRQEGVIDIRTHFINEKVTLN